MKSPIIRTKLPSSGFLKFEGKNEGSFLNAPLAGNLRVGSPLNRPKTKGATGVTLNPQTTLKLPSNGGGPEHYPHYPHRLYV